MITLHPIPFFFIRHGESVWNAEHRVQGQTDVPLSVAGLLQAREVAGKLAVMPVGGICSSPLQRARRTAEIINESFGYSIRFIDELMEARLGELEGQPYEAGLGDWYRGTAPDGAETKEAFFARAISGLNRALENWRQLDCHPLIVAHGGVFKAVQHHLLRCDEDTVANCQPLRLLPPDVEGQSWRIEKL